MAYPPGISLAVIQAGKAGTFFGDAASLTATVTPVLSGTKYLVHSATGDLMVPSPMTFTAADDSVLSFSVPHVDQAGYLDDNATPYTMWAYKVDVTVLIGNGRQVKKHTWTKNFQPLVGQDFIDIDQIASGVISEGVTAPTAEVLSINGETGHVLVDAGADDGQIAALVHDETSSTNIALSSTFALKTEAGATDADIAAFVSNPASVTRVALETDFALKGETSAADQTGSTHNTAVRGGLGPLYAGYTKRTTEPVGIVVLGSSTPAGMGASTTDNRWFNKFIKQLQGAYPNGTGGAESAVGTDTKITTAGIHGYNLAEPGKTSTDYLTAAKVTTIGALQPRAVIHMVGSNDMAYDIGTDYYRSQIIAGMDNINAAAPGPIVHILVHAHPRDGDQGTFNHTWDEYGEALRSIALERADAVMVDVSRAFRTAGLPATDPLGLLGDDLIHLTDAGHDMTARLVTWELNPNATVSAQASHVGNSVSDAAESAQTGRKLAAGTAGRLSETAPGVTIEPMVQYASSSPTSIATVTFTETGQLITTSAPHGLAVGDRVGLAGLSGVTGMSVIDDYVVRSVPDATTLTFQNSDSTGARTFTGNGTATGLYRRAFAWDRRIGGLYPGMRVTEGRAVQVDPNWPRYDHIKPDPSVVTYSPGILTGTEMRITTEYTGDRIDLLVYPGGSNSGRIIVDGLEVGGWTSADFTAAGVSGARGRLPVKFADARRRTVEIVFKSASDSFVGFDGGKAPLPSYPLSAGPKGARWLISGDSFTEGTGSGTSWGYTRWIAEHLGWKDLWRAGSGSTGYVADGDRTALIDRYQNDILDQNPDGVILAYGLNDGAAWGTDRTQVTAAAATVWDAILADTTIQDLVIIGPWPNNGGTGVAQTFIDMDATLKGMAADRGLHYISPISEGWTFTMSDGTHPDPAGHKKLGRLVAGHLSV